MIKDKVGKAVGTTNEIVSLCKEVNFGKNQICNICYCYIDQYSFLGLSITVKHGLTLL